MDIVKRKRVKLNGIVGIYPANSVGDDIEVYEDETRSTTSAKFYGMRQQAEKADGEFYQCLGDFVAPKATGVSCKHQQGTYMSAMCG